MQSVQGQKKPGTKLQSVGHHDASRPSIAKNSPKRNSSKDLEPIPTQQYLLNQARKHQHHSSYQGSQSQACLGPNQWSLQM